MAGGTLRRHRAGQYQQRLWGGGELNIQANNTELAMKKTRQSQKRDDAHALTRRAGRRTTSSGDDHILGRNRGNREVLSRSSVGIDLLTTRRANEHNNQRDDTLTKRGGGSGGDGHGLWWSLSKG